MKVVLQPRQVPRSNFQSHKLEVHRYDLLAFVILDKTIVSKSFINTEKIVHDFPFKLEKKSSENEF